MNARRHRPGADRRGRGFDSQFRPPGEELPNGAVRSCYPFSESAAGLHPARFAYHVVVDSAIPSPTA